MKRSDLFIVLAAIALLRPCFFKNKVKTALASSFSAVRRAGETTFKLADPSISESVILDHQNIVLFSMVKRPQEFIKRLSNYNESMTISMESQTEALTKFCSARKEFPWE